MKAIKMFTTFGLKPQSENTAWETKGRGEDTIKLDHKEIGYGPDSSGS
jgi:hypothetical protein